MPNNGKIIFYSQQLKKMPHVDDLDKIDPDQKRYNEEHFKTACATTILFEIYADVVHPLSHEIYFVHGSSIKITKTNMNSFNVLQVQGN
jgi:hypothetical protein